MLTEAVLFFQNNVDYSREHLVQKKNLRLQGNHGKTHVGMWQVLRT